MKKIKEAYIYLRDLYRKWNLTLVVALLGPFVMGSVHLVSLIIQFDWIVSAYCAFFYLSFLIRLIQWVIEKTKVKINPYLMGTVSILLLLIPMMAAFVLTIYQRESPHYMYQWFIYVYAAYGFAKFILAIKKLSEKGESKLESVLNWYRLIGAAYTIQMMEFALISTFSPKGGEGIDSNMLILELATQGVIFLLSLFIMGYFLYRFVKDMMAKKKAEIEMDEEEG
ncbi:MAG: hypothetical protein K6B65_01315 [Bacilli bacterium]|nr:hypothetical protein [Bacilli bacterium]